MVVPVEVTLSCLAFGPVFPHCGDHEPPYPCDNWHFFLCVRARHCLAFVAPQAQSTVCYRIYNAYLLSDTDPGRDGEKELSMEFYERDRAITPAMSYV